MTTRFEHAGSHTACETEATWFAAIRRAWRNYKQKAEYRRAIAQLSTMNDHELFDIGITRGDIHFAVHNGRQALRRRNSEHS